MTVSIQADGQTRSLKLAPGTTVKAALNQAGIIIGSLDRTEPPMENVLTDQTQLQVIRVKEIFEVNEVTIPFDHQIIHNESLPEGETLLVQPGVNGTREITYRRVLENNKEISNQEFKTTVIKNAIPEIVMVGIQSPFAATPIPGHLAYLTGGNAWVMEGSTGNRRPLITTGDLDGRIFSLSPDGAWLLYTVKPSKDSQNTINTLWVIKTTETGTQPIDLKTTNVIHYAGWVKNAPNPTITYSTVEPRETAPGWQANNDLNILTFSQSGFLSNRKTIVQPNSGGIYGWWGTNFAWSADGSQMAYARPDSVGLVDLKTGTLQSKLDLIPYQTHSNWAWVPGLAWSPEQTALFTVVHKPAANGGSNEDSQFFDLTALIFAGGQPLSLYPQSGMFAYPSPSPLQSGKNYQIAFLKAIFPEQSETSHYRLVVIDRDGSDRKELFPDQGSPGIDPQRVIWSPKPRTGEVYSIAVLYQGNLWLVDSNGQQTIQVTGDGLTTQVDWK
ncbi:MAG TPA: G5 domain-containing protein [Anaerolineaceae bacterium]|nr:G5 domain-containing protein [Anaerolineaceae bacterium]